jgi:hypothetical protein
VGYLRPPISDEPRPGMTVEVRTRGLPRTVGSAHILEVGTQLEAVPATLLGPMKLANTELGLPVEISLPEQLKIRAGELVDILLLKDQSGFRLIFQSSAPIHKIKLFTWLQAPESVLLEGVAAFGA